MSKVLEKNTRIKRKYLQWLATAKGSSPSTVSRASAAIAAFESSTNRKDFAAFHTEQPLKFQRDLMSAVNPKSRKPLAKSTIRSRLMDVKAFFKWLADRPGYKSRINHSDCEYFNMSANDVRVATAKRKIPFPTLDEVNQVLDGAPCRNAVEKRDRAIIAFTLLTGMRDAAIASLPLGMVNVEKGEVFQDARDVITKNAKTSHTYFFPIAGNAREIVSDWIFYLRNELGYSDEDPLFPKTEVSVGESGGFIVTGLICEFWTSAAPIRRIFKERFEAAGLRYFNPHSIRKTLMRVAYDMKIDAEALKAWSQNLSHENLATSLNSYGKVHDWRTAEIMQALAMRKDPSSTNEADLVPPPEMQEWLSKILKDKLPV